MTENELHINEAIHECLERCYSASLPIACLAEYLEGLRQDDPAWSMADVDLIERHARLILKLIIQQPPVDRLSA